VDFAAVNHSAFQVVHAALGIATIEKSDKPDASAIRKAERMRSRAKLLGNHFEIRVSEI
jgi:hypothetical protein